MCVYYTHIMKTKVFEHVQRLEKYIEENKKDMVTIPEVSNVLSVSPTYASEIMKMLAYKKNWKYYKGALFVGDDSVRE